VALPALGLLSATSVAAIVLGAGGASGQGTPTAPTAKTGTANHVHIDSARLHGIVDPNGAPTTYRFRYGHKRPYDRSTQPVDAGSGSDPVPVSVVVPGLAHGTRYHYRLEATSTEGTATGRDRKLTTLDPRVKGRFAIDARIVVGGRPFGQPSGKVVHRTYVLAARCGRVQCGSLKVNRKGLRGHYRSVLRRRGPGAYRGTEHFDGGRCDNGLRFHTNAKITMNVTRTKGDHAAALKGRLRVRAGGCVDGTQRSHFKGTRRGAG
jgi:hypothetical protein